MIRLHIVAEGQTEEEFVNSVLALHLGTLQIVTDVRCIETSRNRRRIFRGGFLGYAQLKRDLERWMKEDDNADSFFSTMLDLYKLPGDFPRHAQLRSKAPVERALALEQSFATDVNRQRFVPYIQLHEFEALLFADPVCFSSRFLNQEAAVQELIKITNEFGNPELIDDGEHTSPSKRIIARIPEYEGSKATAGPLIAGKIGIPKLRQRCEHFDGWVTILEALANP